MKKRYQITITRTFEYEADDEEQALEMLAKEEANEQAHCGSAEWLNAAVITEVK